MVGVDGDTDSARSVAGGCQDAANGAAFPSDRCAAAALVTATLAADAAPVSGPEVASPAFGVLALDPASVADGPAAAAAPVTAALAVVAAVGAAAAAVAGGTSATGLEGAFSEGQSAAAGKSGIVGHVAVPA